MTTIEVEKMSIDQLAGAVVLFLGAVGSLLLVIWQSKCHCKVNLCYIFQCERRPPNEEELKGLKDQAKKLKAKNDKKQNKILEKEDEILEKEDILLKENSKSIDLEVGDETLVPTPKKVRELNLQNE
jgi:hypothetical protein